MAVNRNNDLSNNHHLICGQSGCGKTTFIIQSPDIKKAKRLIAWDPYEDHPIKTRFEHLNDLKKYVAKCLRDNKGFRVAYTPNADNNDVQLEGELVKFLDVVWMIGDGEKLTHVIIEEVAEAYSTIGKAKGRAGQIFRAGRSYGLVVYAVTQSTAEIPKTIVKQCAKKVVFFHDMKADIERAAELCGRTPDNIIALQKGEYYIKQAGMINGELKRTRRLSQKSKR